MKKLIVALALFVGVAQAEPKYELFCEGQNDVTFLAGLEGDKITTKFPDGQMEEFRVIRRTESLIIGENAQGLMIAFRKDGAWAVTLDKGLTVGAGGMCQRVTGV